MISLSVDDYLHHPRQDTDPGCDTGVPLISGLLVAGSLELLAAAEA